MSARYGRPCFLSTYSLQSCLIFYKKFAFPRNSVLDLSHCSVDVTGVIVTAVGDAVGESVVAVAVDGGFVGAGVGGGAIGA